MSKYRSKGDLGARTEIERDNTEHILDQQSRVRVSKRVDRPRKETARGNVSEHKGCNPHLLCRCLEKLQFSVFNQRTCGVAKLTVGSSYIVPGTV